LALSTSEGGAIIPQREGPPLKKPVKGKTTPCRTGSPIGLSRAWIQSPLRPRAGQRVYLPLSLDWATYPVLPLLFWPCYCKTPVGPLLH